MPADTAVRKRESGYAKHPNYRVDPQPCPKRLRVMLNGETIVDTTDALLVHETRHIPVYYFPRAAVAQKFLHRTAHDTFCPFKGTASYWSIKVGDRTAENAVWSYEEPFEEVAGLKDYMAFYWDRVDAWYEEDEQVYVHARDPHVRIDILDSARPVQVVLGGETVADTVRARFLFETGLPTRYYIPREDISATLEPSDLRTSCPYKGDASYWTVRIGETRHDDIVWSYSAPVHESARIKDYFCFFNERVDAILVDGKEIPKMKTKWSVD